MVGGVRGAAARNIFKAWLLVALLAAAFAGVGWLLADERGAILFAFCSLLAASAAYARRRPRAARHARRAPVRARRGSAAPLDGRPALGAARRHAAEAPADRRRRSRGRSSSDAGRGARRSPSATGLLTALTPGEVEAVLAHELAHVRSATCSRRPTPCCSATTLLELTRVGGFLSRFLLAVLAPIAAAFTHLLLSPKRELGGRPDRRAAGRPARPRGRADPPRSRRRARRVPRLAGDRAALTGEPVRPRRERSHGCSSLIRRSPSGCARLRGLADPESRAERNALAAAAPLRRPTRPARRTPASEGRRRGRLRLPRRRKPAASYSPRGLRPKYHRRERA